MTNFRRPHHAPQAAAARLWCLGALVTSACAAPEKSVPHDDSASPGTTAPPDTHTPEDTSAPVDTDPPTPTPTARAVTGSVRWPASAVLREPLAIAALPISFQAEEPVLGLPLTVAPIVDDTFSFVLEVPADDVAMTALAPRSAPELMGFLVAFVVFVPEDPSAPVFSADRPLRAAPFDAFGAFLAPGTLGTTGLSEGWSLLDLGMAGSYDPPRCLLTTSEPLFWRAADGYPREWDGETPLTIDLRGIAVDLFVSGTSTERVADRLAAIPQQVATGETSLLAPMFDVSLTDDTFSVHLVDSPASSYDISGDTEWQHTFAYLLQYTDDGDEQWTPADASATTLATVCMDSEPVFLRYTRPVTTWRGLRMLDCTSAQVGWRLVRIDDTTGGYHYLSDTESQNLATGNTCLF